MKVEAKRVGPDLVSLFCTGFLRAPRTVYAHWDGARWSLSSGRHLNGAMLDAIDRLPLAFFTKEK